MGKFFLGLIVGIVLAVLASRWATRTLEGAPIAIGRYHYEKGETGRGTHSFWARLGMEWYHIGVSEMDEHTSVYINGEVVPVVDRPEEATDSYMMDKWELEGI
jgi:hypothetical protein